MREMKALADAVFGIDRLALLLSQSPLFMALNLL